MARRHFLSLKDWSREQIEGLFDLAAAMKAEMAGTDAYLEQWRRVEVNCGPELQAEVIRRLKKVAQARFTWCGFHMKPSPIAVQ